MKACVMLTILAIFALAGALSAGDLYLIKINSQEQLTIVQSRLNYAHGMLADYFIIETDENTVQYLLDAGIEVEKAISGRGLSGMYLLDPVVPKAFVKSLNIVADFEFEGIYLAGLTGQEIESARRAGYIVRALEDFKTPFFYNPPAFYAGMDIDYPSDTLADLISQDSLLSYDTRLEAFRTRYIYSDSVTAARDWIVAKFQSFGYTNVTLQGFWYNGRLLYNVVCTKPGGAEADKVIVIGGHYDSINFDSDPVVYAPGADDNASGVCVVLEMARILKDIPTKKTYIFAAFSAEEVGLVGSYALAEELHNAGTDIEVMLNYDMVAYSGGVNYDVKYFHGPFDGYARVMHDAAARVSTLNPVIAGSTGSSDHVPFRDRGYNVVYTQEGLFNYGGWHTDLDISSRLDFPYFEQLTRAAAAGVGVIDNAAKFTRIDAIYDVGNGSELLVDWVDDCEPTYTYKVLYGTASGIYTDTSDVPPGECDHTISGLADGQTYYAAVAGTNVEGYGPLFLIEKTGQPNIIPRPPQRLKVDPDYQKLALVWGANNELDLNYYRIMRKDPLNDWAVLDETTDTTYTDTAVDGHKPYQYKILAVDNDLNESTASDIVSAIAATFDSGILFVEETSAEGGLNPAEYEQTAYYDSIFTGISFVEQEINTAAQALSRSSAGQYGTIFWFDDDINVQLFSVSADSVSWYLGYPTNFVLAGWRTIINLSGGGVQGPGDFLYDAFEITGVTEQEALDFTGATGQGGWPSVQVKPGGIFGGALPVISKLTLPPASSAQVIYTFNSQSGNPNFNGQPVGVAYEIAGSRRVALSFPIYYLTSASASALMAKIINYFGQEIVRYGDANGDGAFNLLDILLLIRYKYESGPAPVDPNLADVNGDCAVNLLDILYMIAALYEGGPDPVMGCVE
jgi:hypothetical protein